MDMYEDTTSFFEQLSPGLAVCDLTGEKIGTINHFRMPSHPYNPKLESFPYDLATVNVPVDVVRDLLRSGLVCVKTGLLRKDRIIAPEQIAVIADGRMYLNVRKEDLISL